MKTLALLLLTAFPGFGAVSIVQSIGATSATSGVSVAFASNNTAGNTIRTCMFFFDTGTSTPTVSDSRGNTYVAAPNTGIYRGSGVQEIICLDAFSIASGANTVTWVCPGGLCVAVAMMAYEFSGTASSNTGWQFTGSTTASTASPASSSITLTNAGAVCLVSVEFASGRTTTVGNIFGSAATLSHNFTGGSYMAEHRSGISAGASGTGDFTASGTSTWQVVIFSIEEPSGGGGGGTPTKKVMFVQ